MTTISDEDLIIYPRAVALKMTVRGRAHVLQCRPKRKFGYRLRCPLCGLWVLRVSIAEGDDKFGCGVCKHIYLGTILDGPAVKGKWSTMRKRWGKRQY